MAMFRGQKVSGFVQKPYTSPVLTEKIKIAIDAAALWKASGNVIAFHS